MLNNTNILLLGLFFLFLLVFVLSKPKVLSSRSLYLLRALFPSWKFFDRFGYMPTLFYRLHKKENDFGPWELCLQKPPRQWRRLFLNPQGNHLLATTTLLQQLTSEIQGFNPENPAALVNSTPYKMTLNLVSGELQKKYREKAHLKFQFKVSLNLPNQPEAPEDVLISPVHSLTREQQCP